MPDTNVTIAASFPGEAIIVQVLKLISQQQEMVMTAPPEYRQQYFDRLNKMEDFWYKLLEPIGKAILKTLPREA